MMRSFTSVPLLLSSQCLALSVWGRAGPLKEQRQEEPSSGPIPTWRVDSLASGSLLDLRRECESSPWRVLFSHLYSFAFLEARLGDPHFCGCGQFGKGGFSLKVRLPPYCGRQQAAVPPSHFKNGKWPAFQLRFRSISVSWGSNTDSVYLFESARIPGGFLCTGQHAMPL